jgi:hypothetical protein
MDEKRSEAVVETPKRAPTTEEKKNGSSRRAFLGHLGGAAAATVAASTLLGPLAKSAEAVEGERGGEIAIQGVVRANNAKAARVNAANRERAVALPPHTTNGDEQLYQDRSASYSKGLLQSTFGVVNPSAWQSFKKAIASGSATDWNNIVIGGTRTQNGPQGAYAFTLEGTDSGAFGNAPSPENQQNLVVVPPFAAVASADYGQQLVENYWGSLLRDVAFTDYGTNTTAIAAAAEMTTFPDYKGPRDINGNVTTDLLFRGGYPGETVGPYMSQFMILPTSFGQQPLSQQMTTYVANVDYMTDLTTWQQVQNGSSTGLSLQKDSTLRFLHDGRGLGAWTHADVLFQGYFIAFLVLAGLGAPVNPGSPYFGNRTQNGFGTFGGPDFAASLGEIAAKAINAVWYQKWLVHLTPRPESGGGLVHLELSGIKGVQAVPNSNVLNSQAVAQTFSKTGSWLCSQAFPEGSPTHPSYPTGHGTVAGACITLLKFFFDETFVFTAPMMPANDGLSLVPFVGSPLTVGGELNKLAHNVSFGHGIHPSIHWRSDTDQSIVLGETFAISYLQEKAKTYNEKFTISFTKVDGTTCTISNE